MSQHKWILLNWLIFKILLKLTALDYCGLETCFNVNRQIILVCVLAC